MTEIVDNTRLMQPAWVLIIIWFSAFFCFPEPFGKILESAWIRLSFIMMRIMCCSRHYLEIFYSVVLPILVFVMNNFRWKKSSPKMFFHDMPMLKNILIVHPNAPISGGLNLFVEFPVSPNVSLIPAFKRTILNAFFYSVCPGKKPSEAFFACEGNARTRHYSSSVAY